jgi:DNA primase catalytic core, N-terminal domain/CHC2 zinc finger
MVTTWVDFKQLKTDVAIEEVVAHYGVHLRRVGGTELRGRCPLPTHSSSRSRDSFAVNIARNVWSCRSLSCMQARAGRPGGNILDFVALMERSSIREAALRLQQWSGAAPERFIVPRASRPDPVASENPPLPFALQYVDGTHPYLRSRGLTPQTIRTFGFGLYTGKGLLRGRIVIPIHNAAGELIAYAGRAIDGQEPKYRFPAGFRKSLVLFNLHRAIATNGPLGVVRPFELMVARGLAQQLVDRRRLVVDGRHVDADHLMLGVQLVARAQLEARDAVAIDAHEVQAVRRHLDRDALHGTPVAAGEQRRLPARLRQVVHRRDRQTARGLRTRRFRRRHVGQVGTNEDRTGNGFHDAILSGQRLAETLC